MTDGFMCQPTHCVFLCKYLSTYVFPTHIPTHNCKINLYLPLLIPFQMSCHDMSFVVCRSTLKSLGVILGGGLNIRSYNIGPCGPLDTTKLQNVSIFHLIIYYPPIYPHNSNFHFTKTLLSYFRLLVIFGYI